ncbi:MAG: hypothetical protein IMZ65_00410 [Planctomycetes bacterium]|nr:hypothetical protein [Planctomycetota bacterium]
MTRAIQAVCWDVFRPLEGADDWAPGRDVLAVWPSPVNADACFSAAGFEEFTDPDDQYDREWQEMIAHSLDYLGRFGCPKVRRAAEVYENLPLLQRWLNRLRFLPGTRRVDLPIVEQMDLVTTDDRFGNVAVEFGQESRVLLKAGHGHPILFVQFAVPCGTAIEDFVRQVAEERPVSRRMLDWSKLA